MTSVCPHGVKMGWPCEACMKPKPRLLPEDIKVDVYRTGASNAMQLSGRSGVRLTYEPTGDSVAIYGPGSQLKLKDLAMRALTEVVLG